MKQHTITPKYSFKSKAADLSAVSDSSAAQTIRAELSGYAIRHWLAESTTAIRAARNCWSRSWSRQASNALAGFETRAWRGACARLA